MADMVITSATADVYLQYLTGSSSARSVLSESGSDGSSLFTTSDSGVDTTYLDQAAQGQTLSSEGQKAAVEELKALMTSRILDITA